MIDHAVDDLTITVEAGLPLNTLQELLAEQGQWLPVDWPRGGCAGSIGGLVARGLAGGLRQRHLAIRDQLIGIGLLRSDGIAAKAGGRVVKNVAGYDLMRLLCGSWGSLALITEVTLRLQPMRLSTPCSSSRVRSVVRSCSALICCAPPSPPNAATGSAAAMALGDCNC